MKTGAPKPVERDARTSSVTPASWVCPLRSFPDRFGHMTHGTADGLSTRVSTRAVSSTPSRWNARAERALKASATLWFLVAVIGQWMFVTYILAFYGRSALQGNWGAWNQVLAHGIVPGHTMGNVALAVHLAIAAIITLGGPLQLIPLIRAKAPSFHRWNGRLYLFTAFVGSISGLYMIWTKEVTGDVVQHVGISVNAILIMLCAALALRYALARNFRLHRQWALRLYLAVSGVWFFRVGLMFWIAVNQGPAGFDPKTFQGPFLSFLSFAQYLVPLAILEIYLRARDTDGAGRKFVAASGLVVLTVAMGVGIGVATRVMWLPRM